MKDKDERLSFNILLNESAYERSTIGGFVQKLSSTFQDAASLSSENLKNLDHDNDVNILMGGDGVTSRMSLQALIAHNHHSSEKKKEDFIEFLLELSYQQIIENLQEARKLIAEAIDRMDDLIRKADEEIARIQEQLQNITRRHHELNDAIEAGYFDRFENGTYKSKAIADTIATYEQRTRDVLPNDVSPDMLILMLTAQMDFEKSVMVSALENDLVKLHEFRDGVQSQKETLEEESERIENAIKAIDTDTSLTDEERRIKKVEILEQASATALDAQMAAGTAEAEYVELVAGVQKENTIDGNTYITHSNNENTDLNQLALDELETIKPIIPPIP